ncbi:MAG TPA: response regulator [Ktedonobacterales bacterium]
MGGSSGLADRSNMTAIEQRPILVVDDDDTIAMTLESFLVEEGYPVMVAHNGQEALERVEESSPAVILLDMKMPVMDGWAFASAYRQQDGPHAPIIVMTAAHDSRQRASEIAADGFVPKPFDLDELLALIRRYIPES